MAGINLRDKCFVAERQKYSCRNCNYVVKVLCVVRGYAQEPRGKDHEANVSILLPRKLLTKYVLHQKEVLGVLNGPSERVFI
jgi:hypothetical protein